MARDSKDAFTNTELVKLDPSARIGTSGQVVLQLLLKSNAFPAGTNIYFDNYFTSPPVLIKLKELGYPAALSLRLS